MREPAMVSELHHWPFKSPEHVEVWRFGRQRHRRGGQRAFAVEYGSPKNSAGQEMGNRFQVKFVTQLTSCGG